jgi:hypothetical protein
VVARREFAEAPYYLIFRQHGELVNSDSGGHVQTSLPPMLKGEIEIRFSWLRRDGRRDEIVISRVEENYSRAHFAAGPLMEVNPYQDDFTGP